MKAGLRPTNMQKLSYDVRTLLTSSGRASLRVKTILICLLFIAISSSSFAAKKYSAGGGNWTSTGTWVGGIVPVSGDTVIVQNAHIITIINANLYSNSTYMFLIVLGTLDLRNNGKLSFNASSKVIIETGGLIMGDGNSDTISIGTGTSEYRGGQGNVTGPSYISDGHTPSSGEGTGGCGCYTSVGNCTISSTDGYKVHINVWATQIVVTTSPCTNGYNYNVRLNYNISFSGTNIPASLWWLAGTVHCGSSSHTFELPENGGSGSVDAATGWRMETDCATATPQSLNCLNATIQIQGPGIAANTSCSTTLPIKLLKFEAGSVVQGAQLRWTTSMEKNFNYFQIERAQKDLSFLPIATVEGKGGLDINTSYTYLDKQAQIGKNYYRLKSIDYDGAFEYSKVVHVNWENASGITVYPNPSIDHDFTIDLNDGMDTPSRMHLSDQLGHVVYQSELNQPSSKIQLPKTVQPGLYYLRVFSGHQQEIIKVVIQ